LISMSLPSGNLPDFELRIAQRAGDDGVQLPLARQALEGLRHRAEEAVVVHRDENRLRKAPSYRRAKPPG